MTREGAGAQERAAETADWQQVVLNGGPPCFALDPHDKGRFCLRAERWDGHHPKAEDYLYPYHRYVSIAALLRAASAVATEKERERCMMAIRAACAACDGTGYADGNPDDATECEYCGRPRDAILGRGDEQEGAPSARTDAPKKE